MKGHAESAEKTGGFGYVGSVVNSPFAEGAPTSDRQFVRGQSLKSAAEEQGVGLMKTLKSRPASEDPGADWKLRSGLEPEADIRGPTSHAVIERA